MAIGVPGSLTESDDPYHLELKRIRRSDCLTFEEFDKKYNVDTYHPIELAHDGSGEYRPSFIPNYKKFEGSAGLQNTPLEILDHLNDFFSTYAGIEDYTFIDVGSGKGKTVLHQLIKNAPYKDYLGVEIDKDFNDVALNNLKTININISKDVSFVEANVLDYEFPESKCIYYFYYPFDKNIFTLFMKKNLLKMINSKSLIVFLFESEYNFKQYFDVEPIYSKYKTKVYALG